MENKRYRDNSHKINEDFLQEQGVLRRSIEKHTFTFIKIPLEK